MSRWRSMRAEKGWQCGCCGASLNLLWRCLKIKSLNKWSFIWRWLICSTTSSISSTTLSGSTRYRLDFQQVYHFVDFLHGELWIIFQLLLLTFAAALYRTLKKKEGELSRGGDRGNGRAVNDLQDGLELNRWGPEVDVEVEGRLEGRTSKTPPSSPRLREVRVVRGMRRRLGSSLWRRFSFSLRKDFVLPIRFWSGFSWWPGQVFSKP